MRAIVLLCLLFGCDNRDTTEELDPDADGDGFAASVDCDDANERVYPGAPDARGDGCDADCGVQADADGDDWPDDVDCAPSDPTIYPCAVDLEGDGVDADCGGEDGTREGGCVSEDPTTSEVAPFMTAACELPYG